MGQLFFNEESVYEISKLWHSPFKRFRFHRKAVISIKIPYFLSKFYGKFSKVNHVIYSSVPTIIPNMKALAQTLFEISYTQDFQILFSKGHNSEKGHNSNMKKYGSTNFS